ncbi:hypothetical protein D1871_08925 [Nakamurella silvestris]|nr:hypothetical protein D1871_08925 [Nakamurella silvestris]
MNDIRTSDAGRRVVLGDGLCVIERDAGTVQIGSDPPQCYVLHNVPPGTAGVLAALGGPLRIAEVLSRLEDSCGGDPEFWSALLRQLRDAGVLHILPDSPGPDTSAPVVRPERVPLSRYYGPDLAQRFLARRNDALVTIAGTGRVAAGVSSILVSAGIGHVHISPDRPLQPVDTAPAGVSADAGQHLPDRTRLAAVAQRVRPEVATHPPVPAVPDLVVVAGDGPAEALDVITLLREGVPHLAAYATGVRGVIGPLVLPGRSSCLICQQLHRTGWDPAWPTVGRAAGAAVSVPTSCLATMVAAAAADQVLQFVDGRGEPATVNGTLEWRFGDWRPRRRSWAIHGDCLCRSLPER